MENYLQHQKESWITWPSNIFSRSFGWPSQELLRDEEENDISRIKKNKELLQTQKYWTKVSLWKTRTMWSMSWSWRVTLSASTFPLTNSDLQNCRACSRVRPMPLRKRPYCMRPPCRRWWFSLSALWRCLIHRGKDLPESWRKRRKEKWLIL